MAEIGRQLRQQLFIDFIMTQIDEFEAELLRQGQRKVLFTDQTFKEADFAETLVTKGEFFQYDRQILSCKRALLDKNCSDVFLLVIHCCLNTLHVGVKYVSFYFII